MTGPATFLWFARHELCLFWRDWISLLTGGRPERVVRLVLVAGIFVGFMHLLAFAIVVPVAETGIAADKRTLIVLTCGVLLSSTAMTSQAMDSVTKAFYARGDLDLILSSPAPAARLFAVRMTAIALSTTALTLVIAGPFINALWLLDGARWLSAYGVILALGASAAAFAILLTIALFRALGPKATRAISQILAAVIGAAFVIGVQVAAILSIGRYTRFSFLGSDWILVRTPDLSSSLWWPARAAMGEAGLLALLLAAGAMALALVIAASAPGFGGHVVAAAGASFDPVRRRGRPLRFRAISPKRALRAKEWTALIRDPWLMSESLMQILYLLPPALLLWLNFGSDVGSLVILVPVMVMAAGQLAGGLAWLAVSGEDAPELIASAPVSPRAVVSAKVEAVLGAVTMVFAPLVAALALAAPRLAAAAAGGIVVSALSGTMIQIWFRAQAKRSRFRNRQTSSRLATLAEALSSISWAGTAVLVVMGTWLAAGVALFAGLILLCAWAMSPSRVLADRAPA